MRGGAQLLDGTCTPLQASHGGRMALKVEYRCRVVPCHQVWAYVGKRHHNPPFHFLMSLLARLLSSLVTGGSCTRMKMGVNKALGWKACHAANQTRGTQCGQGDHAMHGHRTHGHTDRRTRT